MTLKEAYEKRRQECLSLQRQLKESEKTIEELSVGTYVDKEKADEEYLTSSNRYFETDERRLIARLKKYRKN